MEPQREADETLSDLHKCSRQLKRGIITPEEAANKVFDTLAHEERYDLVDEAMRLLPPEAQERLKVIVAELDRPGAPFRTFALGLPNEAREEYDRRMHSQFVHLATLLQQYWDSRVAGEQSSTPP